VCFSHRGETKKRPCSAKAASRSGAQPWEWKAAGLEAPLAPREPAAKRPLGAAPQKKWRGEPREDKEFPSPRNALQITSHAKPNTGGGMSWAHVEPPRKSAAP